MRCNAPSYEISAFVLDQASKTVLRTSPTLTERFIRILKALMLIL
jgi:hypothetical protein